MAIAEINELKEFDMQKQLTFAYLASERFCYISEFFAKQYKYGDASIFREAINFIYDAILAPESIAKNRLENFLQSIFTNAPSTNEFPDFHGTIAMYSRGIIYESLNVAKNEENSRALTDISDLAINIIDCYVQIRDEMDYGDENLEEKILNDDSMQTELNLQKGIISYMAKIDRIEASAIATLMRFQEEKNSGLII